MNDDDLLTVAEAAQLLKLKPQSIYSMIRRGKLPAYSPGGHIIRIRRGDLYQRRQENRSA